MTNVKSGIMTRVFPSMTKTKTGIVLHALSANNDNNQQLLVTIYILHINFFIIIIINPSTCICGRVTVVGA